MPQKKAVMTHFRVVIPAYICKFSQGRKYLSPRFSSENVTAWANCSVQFQIRVLTSDYDKIERGAMKNLFRDCRDTFRPQS